MFTKSTSRSLSLLAALVSCSFLIFTSPASAQQSRILPNPSNQDFQTRILNGTETDQFPSVGIIGSVNQGGFCSGTLISNRHVLTAAHCLIEIESDDVGTFAVGGSVYRATEIIIHPDYNPRNLDNDLAILVLENEITDVTPSPIYRNVPMIGQVLSIVGFGGGGTAPVGSDGTFGIKRVGTTMIDEVDGTLIIWNFDDASEANTAAGDSGGPGYIQEDGQFFVASITSGGSEPDSALGDRAFNTRVDSYITWIDSAVSTAPQEPDEPPTDDDPTDEPTDSSPMSDCAEFLNGPFPLLRLIIYWFTALYENATGEDINNDGVIGTTDSDSEDDGTTEPADTTEVSEATDMPAVDAPVVNDPTQSTQPIAGQTPGTTDTPTTGADAPVTQPPATQKPRNKKRRGTQKHVRSRRR